MIKRCSCLIVALATVCVMVPLAGPDQRSHAAGVIVGRVHRYFQPGDAKTFVLVIGSDARSGNPNAANADAIHIAGLNSRTMRGGVLNFPRDSLVGGRKINSIMLSSGPAGLARALENLTGIRIDYWVMVGFEGFRDIVDGVGPIPLRLTRGIYDPRGSGARLPTGKRKMVGGSALAYVRTRKVLAGGDITRSHNQGRFLLAMLRKLRADVRRNPASLFKWIAAGHRHARFDLSPRDIFRLGLLASRVRARDVGNVTVPASLGWAGAQSVVFIRPGAGRIYARFRRDASL